MVRRFCLAATALLLALPLAGCGFGGPGAPVVGPPEAGDGGALNPDARSAPEDPYAVGVRDLTVAREGRQLAVTIWYPAEGKAGGKARADLEAAEGDFPVVLFSHGLTGLPNDYVQLLTRWAAAGFIVAAPTFPNTNRNARQVQFFDVLNQPADARYVLTEVLALDERSGDPLRGRIDTERVAAAGHSAGAVTTLGLFTTRDERLDAGIVLSGTSLGVGVNVTGRAVPMLFVHGQRDTVVTYQSGLTAYQAMPWPKAMLTLPQGDHGRSMQDGDDPGFKVVLNTTVEFLRWTLYGDEEAGERLPEDATAGGVATLDNQF